MRATILVSVAAVALAAFAASAAAGPANVVSSEGCFQPIPSYEICSSWRTVAQQVTTPSGNAKWSFHFTNDYVVRYLPTGDVVERGTSRSQSQSLLRGDEPRVLHGQSKSVFSFLGMTCTSRFAYQIVNGELRHESISTVCE